MTLVLEVWPDEHHAKILAEIVQQRDQEVVPEQAVHRRGSTNGQGGRNW